MLGAMLLMVQTVIVTSPPPRPVGPSLPQVSSVTARCAPSDDGDIVVCGKQDNDQYRLRPLGPPPNGKPFPPMTMRIGNGTADMHAEEHCTGSGFCAPAAMARIKLPF